jgi:uncharacterized protein (TIGR02246 family)
MTRFGPLDLATDETAVRDLLERMAAAWGANDADAFAELYTEEATVVTAGAQQQGKDEIRAFMAAGFAGPLKGTTSVDELQRIRFVAEDVAIVNSLSGFILPGGKAVLPSLQRQATWVLTRAGSNWLVESYHNCAANTG